MASTLLKIAAIAAAGFFRAGRFFPKDGVTIPVTDLTEKDLERIRAEPNLRVEEVDGDAAVTLSDEELKQMLSVAIATLTEDGFGQDGKPKLEALRAAIPDEKVRITAALRDEVWAALKKPAEPAGQ